MMNLVAALPRECPPLTHIFFPVYPLTAVLVLLLVVNYISFRDDIGTQVL